MRPWKQIGVIATLLLQWLPAFADDVITTFMSSIASYQSAQDLSSEALTDGGIQSAFVSFQYLEDFSGAALNNGGISSPFVSYLFQQNYAGDVLANGGAISSFVSYQYPNRLDTEILTSGGIMSPIASYQYYEWPGSGILDLLSSPVVSYSYPTGGASGAVSASLSRVVVSPGSVAADGQSLATVTVGLLDGNGNPVVGKVVSISAVEQASSGGVATLASVTQPASLTDNNGQATATLTSAVVGTAIISARDVTDGISLLGQPTVRFTSALVAPNSDLNQAIAALYQSSVDSFGDNAPVGADAATYGDQFRAALATDEASAVLDAAFGVVGAVSAGLDSVEYAEVLSLPGLEETGTGPLIKDSAVLSRLFDTELLEGNLSSRVLASGFREVVVSVGGSEAAQDLTDAMVTSRLEQIASQATGLSQVSQATAQKCQLFQQGLQQQEQALLSQGIPPLSAVQQTAWANDLQLRSGVGAASLGVLLQQDHFLMQLDAARQVASGDAVELVLAKFAAEAAATVFFDGPGALLTGGILTLSDEYKDVRNASTDQAGYNTAFSVVGGCLQYDGQAYLNAASAYNEISQARSANAVTATVGQMTDWEEGYQAWGPLRLILNFSVTKAYSLLDLKNTSAGPATFEVFVMSGYASSAYGLSIPNLSQVSIGVMNIAAGAEVQIPVTYYDGQNGGKPDPSVQMVVYVLGNNASGTFYVGKFTHGWNPAIATSQVQFAKPQSPGPRPMDVGTDMENPVVTYVSQNATNQTYQARVFVVNPYNQNYSAIVTQALPAGISVVATDGTVFGSSVVWTNIIPGGGLAKDNFTFSLSLAPGASTNLPAATATFIDLTNNAGSLLSSVAPGFSGLFPVQVSGSVPAGISGSNVPMVVTVTNWTSTNQVGLISVVVADSGGVQVANLSLPFNLGGLANTNLTFVLPGTLPPGAYSVTGSLSINGGDGQVLAGLYVVPAAPITLGAGSTAAGSAGGFTMILQGPIGFSCLIEASTNLVDWQPIQYFVATTSPAYFTDFSATYYNQRFYRAVPLSQVQLPMVPQFGAVRLVSGGGVQVTLLGGVGQAYTVQASTNLVNWVAITNLVLTTGSGQFTDYSATNCPQRFYRAVVP